MLRQPALATDSTVRKALWKKSKALVKAYSTPLGEPWQKPDKAKKKRPQADEAAQAVEEERLVDEDWGVAEVEGDWGVADEQKADEEVDEEQFFPDDDEGEL